MKRSQPIRVLIVDADPKAGRDSLANLEEVENIEVVGLVHNKQSAISEAGTTQPDVLLIDLMLTGLRSIEVIQSVNGTQPDIHILALSPGDPPYDKVILAMQAGALGYVTRDAELEEFIEAIQQVHQGKHWLPLDATNDVLQDAAPELAVSAKERRDRLGNVSWV